MMRKFLSILLLLTLPASAQVSISQLPSVGSLTGTEAIPLVQSGVTYQATPNQIRGIAGSSLSGSSLVIGGSSTTTAASLVNISPTITAQTDTLGAGILTVSPTVTYATPAAYRGIVNNSVVTNFSTAQSFSANVQYAQTSASFSGQTSVGQFIGNIAATNTKNWTLGTSLIGVLSTVQSQAGATGTITGLVNLNLNGSNLASGLTVTTWSHIRTVAPVATGPITNYLGLDLAAVSTATNNTIIGIGGSTTGNWMIHDTSGYASLLSGALTIGSSSAATVSTGEVAMPKIAASGTAPGAGFAKVEWVCGTNSGSAKMIAYAGTSTTPVTVVDNVGSGVSGC